MFFFSFFFKFSKNYKKLLFLELKFFKNQNYIRSLSSLFGFFLLGINNNLEIKRFCRMSSSKNVFLIFFLLFLKNRCKFFLFEGRAVSSNRCGMFEMIGSWAGGSTSFDRKSFGRLTFRRQPLDQSTRPEPCRANIMPTNVSSQDAFRTNVFRSNGCRPNCFRWNDVDEDQMSRLTQNMLTWNK